ncbi:MAG TPA: ArsC/Spx/MgsR family protein, partial [Plasticicumulans sp.]|nr:ArsC/Spx/MgsR family protein [Plasticicumulans sp.]
RGTTWRALPEDLRRQLDDGLARTLMLEQPALIRRPLLVRADGALRLGWDENGLADWLAGA